jgi:thiamine phosphate synthase YjbQ (UPF0047 family)
MVCQAMSHILSSLSSPSTAMMENGERQLGTFNDIFLKRDV